MLTVSQVCALRVLVPRAPVPPPPHRGNKGEQDTQEFVLFSLTAAELLHRCHGAHTPHRRRGMRAGSTQSHCCHLRQSGVVLARLTILSHPKRQYRGQPRQREWHLIRLAAESAGVSVVHPRRPGRTIICSFLASGLGLPRTALASRRQGMLLLRVGAAEASPLPALLGKGPDTWLAPGKHIMS